MITTLILIYTISLIIYYAAAGVSMSVMPEDEPTPVSFFLVGIIPIVNTLVALVILSGTIAILFRRKK